MRWACLHSPSSLLHLAVGLGVLSQSALGAPVTLQWFESSWATMEDRTADAFMAGYGRVWTPPVTKAEGANSVGYNLFDRFDLGSPSSPTRYGTQAGFGAVVAEQDKAAIGTVVDLILNHNGFADSNTSGFAANGDYPGFVLSVPGDANGDFHAGSPSCDSDPINCRISGLIDIAQEKAHLFVRHPVSAGDPQNIPAGSLYDRPSESNRQYYPDAALPANPIGMHPFNLTDPMAGDPVAENATGLLLRNTRWLLEVVGVDGFRLDAVKHVPDWFFRDYFDRAVWQRGGPDLAGNPTTPFSFGEVFDGNLGLLDDYVCKGGTGNCNSAGGVTGNRDVLDFPLFFALRDQLNGTGLGSWQNIVGSSVDAIFDGNANDGDFGVTFVHSHDNIGAAADNVAHAYLLTRTGSPVVYFRADEWGDQSFPKPGRGDALGGQYGATLTSLIDVHNEYVRGAYLERWIDADILVFERDNTCLVGLSDRADAGYDTRTVATNFAAGTRLHELTGNAADPTVDPNNDIAEVITVAAGGQVTLRIPRSKAPGGATHKRSYVIYGPVNPDGVLSVSPVSTILPADPGSEANGVRRLTPIEVVTSNSFEVRLETTDPDLLDGGEDDLAMLRMDAGLDINGNGHVDSLDGSFVGYGYEDFMTQRVSLESGGVDIGGVQKGLYRQAIDATMLSEGRHYLSVIAFRSRPAGSPPVFETFRKVILIDRTAPVVALAAPATGQAITASAFEFVARSGDRTANRVHLFIDRPAGTDLAALAAAGQGLMTQADRDEFRLLLTGLTRGNHRIDLVAHEPTRAAPGVTTITGVTVSLSGFDGLGDLTDDGKVTNRDIFPFVQAVQGGTFSPAADLSGDGLVNQQDVPLFADKLLGGGVPAPVVQAMVDRLAAEGGEQ